MELRTKRLILRPPTLADIPALTVAVNDPLIAKFTRAPQPFSDRDARHFVTRYRASLQQQGLDVWLIFRRGDDALIGAIDLHDRLGASAQLGYWAAEPARGYGYLTEAGGALLEWALAELEYVHVQIAVDNLASIRLARRLGFTFHSLLPAQYQRGEHLIAGWYGTRTRGELPTIAEDGNTGVNIEALVREFHRHFEMEIGTGPIRGDHPDMEMRLRLIAEEFIELVAAVRGQAAAQRIARAFADIDHGPIAADVVATADALGDLTYVIFGMAILMGIPLNAVIAEIHRSNMTKLAADGTVLTRADGKIQKGPNYQPPQLRDLLGLANPPES
ncbi:MAG: GNAT family N-acetyltransferase [Bowdeniella nasicola]|nr:GNAT family N-acetyltransferase [Bowdeniella nasicola]